MSDGGREVPQPVVDDPFGVGNGTELEGAGRRGGEGVFKSVLGRDK